MPILSVTFKRTTTTQKLQIQIISQSQYPEVIRSNSWINTNISGFLRATTSPALISILLRLISCKMWRIPVGCLHSSVVNLLWRHTGASLWMWISWKSSFTPVAQFKKWNSWLIQCTLGEIFQARCSFNWDDYGLQLVKTQNAVSQIDLIFSN